MILETLAGYKFIGSGSFNAVFAKDDRVYKIGKSTADEYETLQICAMYGLCPPVYGHFPITSMADEVSGVKLTLSTETLGEFLQWLTPDISMLVMAKAQPLWDTVWYRNLRNKKDDTLKRACHILTCRMKKVLGYRWEDNHLGNIGLYEGRLVALDINTTWD